MLTHRGHICIGKLSIIGSDNVLLPGRRQAIIWGKAAILLIETRNNFQWNLKRNSCIFLKNMHLKMSAKWRSYYIGLDVLRQKTTSNYLKLKNNSWSSNDHLWKPIIHEAPYLHLLYSWSSINQISIQLKFKIGLPWRSITELWISITLFLELHNLIYGSP